VTNDPAIVNVPLSKRGDIDRQIDAYKREISRLKRLESVAPDRSGVLHLCRGGIPLTYSNRTQAQRAADRTGGEMYQSSLSRLFHVRFAATTTERT
jgi:hypothetical protein